MAKRMKTRLKLPHLFVLCVYAPCLVVSGFGMVPGRNDDRLRKSNCTECKEILKLTVAQKLPRLMLIKKRILSAVGRVTGHEAPVPKLLNRKVTQTTPSPQRRPYYKYKIISPLELPRAHAGDVVLRFKVDTNSFSGNEEAVGASLLLFVDRRRKMKKGGKGKKIFLEISKLNSDNETWTSLTYLRTRIKKRRLKKISLPVTVAQELLHSDSSALDLKVKCIGCGRLVQLVLRKDSDMRRKNNPNKRHAGRRRKGRKKSSQRRNNPSATPELIIRTRYLI